MPARLRTTPARRGTALVAMLIALLLCGLIVLAIVGGMGRDQDAALARLSGVRAFYAAEAATNAAIRELATGTDEDGNGTVGTTATVTFGAPPASGTQSLSVSGASRSLDVLGAQGAAQRRVNVSVALSPTANLPGFYSEGWESSSGVGSLASNNWSSTPKWSGVVPQLNIPPDNNRPRWSGHQGSRFWQRWRFRLTVPGSGTYTFWTTSDDGVRLTINGTDVILNDTLHASTVNSGTISLSAGTADVELRYFENGGQSVCLLEWQGPGVSARRFIYDSDAACSPAQLMPPVVATTTVNISGDGTASSAYIDAYNSSSGAYGGANILTNQTVLSTNSSSAGGVTLSQSARIAGNVLTPPGSTPTSVVATWSGSTVTGTRTAMETLQAVQEYSPPYTKPASMGSFSSGSNGTVPAGIYTISGWNQWGGTQTLSSGTAIYFVDGDLTLSGTAAINVSAGARLIIILGGTLNISGTARIDCATSPSQCKIYTIEPSGTSDQIVLSNSAYLEADVWAPWMPLNMSGNSRLDGTFRGLSITLSGRAVIHADVANVGTGAASGGTRVLSWTQAVP